MRVRTLESPGRYSAQGVAAQVVQRCSDATPANESPWLKRSLLERAGREFSEVPQPFFQVVDTLVSELNLLASSRPKHGMGRGRFSTKHSPTRRDPEVPWYEAISWQACIHGHSLLVNINYGYFEHTAIGNSTAKRAGVSAKGRKGGGGETVPKSAQLVTVKVDKTVGGWQYCPEGMVMPMKTRSSSSFEKDTAVECVLCREPTRAGNDTTEGVSTPTRRRMVGKVTLHQAKCQRDFVSGLDVSNASYFVKALAQGQVIRDTKSQLHFAVRQDEAVARGVGSFVVLVDDLSGPTNIELK
ncbi:hypothetical protein BGZ63DRAFT_402392 [Mariannaea sp. PMI_226]|nr:hypothetical protein BGZ63DRAFT_402392 [Mariannaea sp. PMI_226]